MRPPSIVLNEGENWFVKLPDATRLVKAEIKYKGQYVVGLDWHSGGGLNSAYFDINDLDFVEEFEG